MANEPDLEAHIAKLREEHRSLEQLIIESERAPSAAGDLTIQRLKRRRLSLWDEIERLRREASRPNKADLAATPEERRIAHLRTLTSSDISALTSEQIVVVSQIKAFIEWLDDPRAECTDGAPQRPDKFAALITISRQYRDCNRYYQSAVGVNASTVWRWASANSRPSKFVGERIVAEVKTQLVEMLWQLSRKHGLVHIPVGAQFVPPLPT